MFLYGIDMLERAIEADILDMAHWDICCAGQDVPPLAFSNGYEAANLGQLSWDAYANMLRDTDLTLSLMYTPHPSYPPYDAACSGSVVLSNKCLNKTEFYGCATLYSAGWGKTSFWIPWSARRRWPWICRRAKKITGRCPYPAAGAKTLPE